MTIILSLLPGRAAAAEIDEILVLEKRIEETIPLDLSRYGSRVEVITAEEIEIRGFTDIGQCMAIWASRASCT